MKSIIIWLLMILCSVFLFNGCSMVGYGIGVEYDSNTAKAAGTEPITFDDLTVGQRVKIELYNNDVIGGIYEGVRESGSEEGLVLLVMMKDRRARVPYTSIEQIYEGVEEKAYGRVIGFLIGFGIDTYLFTKYVKINFRLFKGEGFGAWGK